MSIWKTINTPLREKGFTDEQISAIQDAIRDVHVVPYDRLAEAVNKRREIEQTEQEHRAKLDQLMAERDSMTVEITSLRSELKKASVRHAVETSLMRAGARNPSLVMRMLDLSTAQVSPDGSVSGVDEQIEALRKTDGYMFVSESAPVPMVPMVPTSPQVEGNPVMIHGLAPAASHAPAPEQTDEAITTADALYTLFTHRSMGRWY